MKKIYIDGIGYFFNDGETILDVAERNNIYIPTLCYHHKLKPTGACRLCLVEVEGHVDLAAACETYAIDDMKIFRDTPEVIKHRTKSLEQVLIKHPLDCPVCDKGGECLLQDITYKLGIKQTELLLEKPEKPLKEWGLILYNQNLCVLCERCTKLCHTVNGSSALKLEGNAFECRITPEIEPLLCDFCGICIDNCPVGALLDIPFKHQKRVWDLNFKKSYCMLCPMGCELEYGKHENTIVKSRSIDASMICGIGRYGFQHINNPERLKKALYRDKESGHFKNISTDEAVNLSASKVHEIIKQYGPDSVAILVGSRLSNESIYSIKTFAENAGINKVISDLDFYDRQFFQYYKKFFNSYMSKGSIVDIESTDLVFILGADLSRELISLKWPIMKAVMDKGAKVITMGLKSYDYDNFVDYSLLADDGNFSLLLNNMVYSSNKIFKNIRRDINSSKNITLIIGDEYILHENDFNSLYFLVKFIGFEKIKVLLAGHNKGNFRSILLQNMYNRPYNLEKFIKDLSKGSIKSVIWANFYPYEFLQNSEDIFKNIKNVEYKIALDMFNNKFNDLADVIIPVKSFYEKNDSYIALDGKIIRTKELVSANNNVVSEEAFFNGLSSRLNINVSNNFYKMFDSNSLTVDVLENEDVKIEFIKSNKMQLNECEYKYKLIELQNKNVYINNRYHNGLTTKYAFRTFEDNDFKKTYLSHDYEDEKLLSSRYVFAKGININLKKYS